MRIIVLTLVITMVLLLTCIAALAVKTIAGRGVLRRQCAGIDPYSGQRSGCACSELHKSACRQRDSKPYQPLAVNETLMEEITQ